MVDSILVTSCETLQRGAFQPVSQGFSYVNEQGDYWSIDDILAEEEMVPCMFKEEAKDLGFLDAIDSRNIKAEGSNKKIDDTQNQT